MGKGFKLEELEVYKVAMEIGKNVWKIISGWDYFAKKTIGAQFVDTADSIAFNISEGYGRFHYKGNKNYCYCSRVSAKESLTATMKAKYWYLISDEEYKLLMQKFDTYFGLMFGYINSIGNTPPNETE